MITFSLTLADYGPYWMEMRFGDNKEFFWKSLINDKHDWTPSEMLWSEASFPKDFIKVDLFTWEE